MCDERASPYRSVRRRWRFFCASLEPGGSAQLVELEAAARVDRARAAVGERRGDLSVGRGDDVGVDRRVVEAEALPVLARELARVAVVAVAIRAADRDVRVAERAAD